MSAMTRSRSDYNVACICPMGVELAPVKAMLDEIHPSLSTTRDQNTYVLGEMSGHNLVIAVLPEIGTNAAGTVAVQLLNDFPSVRFGLLVGIGGGVPDVEDEDKDIRLGDVVVSKPTGAFGGVVQFDLGKRTSDGGFQRTGSLNKPPALLRSTVETLMADHCMMGSQVPSYLSTMVQKYPTMKDEYSHPGLSNDVLFKANYPHQGGRTCRSCDKQHTEDRDDRRDNQPKFFYGTIGSANLVVKDTATREDLRKDMNIICVEMEAAGLIDSFPCLVIRGICDYADSHKNKKWQPYAAATAAGYMKELLSKVLPQSVNDTPLAKEVTVADIRTHELLDQSNQIQAKTLEFHSQQYKNTETRYKDDRQRICHQLFKTRPYEQFKDRNPNRVRGTCNWVLNHDRYLTWQKSSQENLLWVSADPGCGKSVLSKSLIDYDFAQKHQSSVCYYFFKDNQEQDEVVPAVCAILHQLFSQQPHLLIHAMQPWEKNGDELVREFSILWKILLDATNDQSAQSVVVVMDALDECQDTDRKNLITELCDFYQQSSRVGSVSKLKVLVTSRPYDNVQRWFEQAGDHSPYIRLRGEDENDSIHDEINLVIDQRVNELSQEFFLSDQHRENLRKQLHEMEHRTYLWLYLTMEEIREAYRDSPYPEEVRIDTVPASVEDAYERILQKITQKQQHHARTILLIILGARRPLTVGEMSMAFEAASAYKGNQAYMKQPNVQHLERRIRQWCSLFVFINHSKLYLIHQTAKEFLLAESAPDLKISHPLPKWKSSIYTTEVERNMATLCVTYMTFNQPDDEITDKDGLVEQKDAFFAYCAEHWTSHLADDFVAKDGGLLQRVLPLFDTSRKQFLAWFEIYWELLRGRQAKLKGLSQHIVAMTGHLSILKHLHETSPLDLNLEDSFGQTCLHKAAEHGHVSMTEWLIQMNSAVNIRDADGSIPLHLACLNGHGVIVRNLLDHGADVNVVGRRGSVLQEACFRGDEQVVQMLLENGAQVNIEVGLNDTPLQIACILDNERVVRMLLENGADVNAKGGLYHTALRAACQYKSESAVRMLLENGADVDANEGQGDTILQVACRQGNERVVQMLLDRNADYKPDGVLLVEACKSENEKLIQLLLKKGATLDGSELKRLPDLMRDLTTDRVRRLLSLGLHIDTLDDEDQTLLLRSIIGARKDVSLFLIEAGADLTVVDQYGRTVVDWLKVLKTNDTLLQSLCSMSDSSVTFDKGRLKLTMASLCTVLLARQIPKSGVKFYQLGYCFLMLGELEEASVAFEQAIQSGSDESPLFTLCQYCSNHFTGVFRVCKVCPHMILCSLCEVRYDMDELNLNRWNMDRCSRHEFAKFSFDGTRLKSEDYYRAWLQRNIERFSDAQVLKTENSEADTLQHRTKKRKRGIPKYQGS